MQTSERQQKAFQYRCSDCRTVIRIEGVGKDSRWPLPVMCQCGELAYPNMEAVDAEWNRWCVGNGQTGPRCRDGVVYDREYASLCRWWYDGECLQVQALKAGVSEKRGERKC